MALVKQMLKQLVLSCGQRGLVEFICSMFVASWTGVINTMGHDRVDVPSRYFLSV
jgi:hypothetical protein